MSHNYHYLFKYVVAGEEGVGKSTFIQQFTEETSRNTYTHTQKINFASKYLKVNELSIKCQVWDMILNSQSLQKSKRSNNLGDSLFKKATAIILLFDVTNRASFQGIERWIQDIRATWGEKVTLGIVGNKMDMVDKRVISQEELTQFAKTNSVYYAECSSHNYSTVENIYMDISKMVLTKLSMQPQSFDDLLKQSGIKRGKREVVESPKVQTIECTSYEMVQSRWNSREEEEQVEEDSERMANVVEELMLTFKKTQILEWILEDFRNNIKERGINYIDELTAHYAELKASKQSNVIQNLFQILGLIRSEFTSSQKEIERISLQNEQLLLSQNNQAQLKELRQKYHLVQKKVEALNIQKIRLQQVKQQKQKNEKDLLAMMQSIKRENKQILQKCERQRRELNELENRNMDLMKQIHSFRELESSIRIKEMVEEKENTEIIQKLDALEESGENGELIARLRKKLSGSSSFINQMSRLPNSY